jgi:hypothetical protein
MRDLQPVAAVLSHEEVTLDCPGCSGRWTYVRYLRGGRAVATDPAVCGRCQRTVDSLAAQSDAALFAPARKVAPCVRCGVPHAGQVEGLICQVGGNPWVFGDASFETVKPWPGRERAYTAAQSWTGRFLGRASEYAPASNLLVWGEHGLAKSLFAHCALRVILESGHNPARIAFVDWPSFITRLQDTYDAGKETWPMIEALHFADVVFLDDVFSGKVTADVLERLNQVLNGREGRWTFANMNPDPNTIQPRWGHLTDDVARLVSRLGRFHVVHPTADDDGRFAPAS